MANLHDNTSGGPSLRGLMSSLEFADTADDLMHSHFKARCVLLALDGIQMDDRYRNALKAVLHSVVDALDDSASSLQSHAKEMR